MLVLVLVLGEVVLVPVVRIRETLRSNSTSAGETPKYEYDKNHSEKLLFHFKMAPSS